MFLRYEGLGTIRLLNVGIFLTPLIEALLGIAVLTGVSITVYSLILGETTFDAGALRPFNCFVFDLRLDIDECKEVYCEGFLVYVAVKLTGFIFYIRKECYA